jgi:hypothetical protein
MKPHLLTLTLIVATAGLPAGAGAADFAPVGAKATLTVEYRFEARGRKQDKYDLHEWTVKRGAELVAELEAKKPAPMPAMQPPDSAQMAKIGQQQAQAQKAATQMAPMMAGAQAIVAKCGDDEKCMEREAMKMGAALSGTKQLDDTLKTGRETAEVMKPGADRYQRWEGTTQKGRYAIDEAWHVVHADPICMSLPKARCTHDMVRKGGGDIAASKTAAAAEVDLQAATLIVQLPMPHGALAYIETQTTDEPQGTHETATPKGPQNGQMLLRLTGDNKSVIAPLKVALKGGWRSQSGEQVVAMGAGGWHGAPGDGGRLVVRWKFSAQ